MSHIKELLHAFKYDAKSYSLSSLVLFSSVIFETIAIANNIVVTDLLYFVFAVLFFFKGLLIKGQGLNTYGCYLYPVFFLILAWLNYIRFGSLQIFQSHLRFVFNCTIYITLLTCFFRRNSEERERLVNTYIYVCVLYSAFISIQYLSFYIFNYNIKLNLGGSNAAGLYIPSKEVNYRTGGFFNEPSWYAVFVSPVLDIAFRKKKYYQLFICIVGILLSTSALGYLSLAIFIVVRCNWKYGKYSLLFVVFTLILWCMFPNIFSRLFDALNFGEDAVNSNNARVIAPFTIAVREMSVWGTNIADLYETYGGIFFNTFTFIFLSFGMAGLVVFLSMIWNRHNLLLSLIIVMLIAIEGCYGRIDFWMGLLATSVFCYSQRRLPAKLQKQIK